MTLEKVYDELYGMIEDLQKKVARDHTQDVEITPTLQSGTKLADYEINGTEGAIYAPAQSITPTLAAGTKLADITLDGVSSAIYSQDFKVYKPSLSGTGTLAPGDSAACDVPFEDFVDDGYTPIFCSPAYAGDAQFAFVQCELVTTGISARIANFSSTSDSGTPTVYVLAIRTMPSNLTRKPTKKK